MADDVMIEVVAGPYRGQRLNVSAAEGAKAITDEWAYDPHAGPRPETPVDQTQEDRDRIYEAAHKAAPRLRGEVPKTEPGPSEAKTRDMTAEEPKAPYRTRDIGSKK